MLARLNSLPGRLLLGVSVPLLLLAGAGWGAALLLERRADDARRERRVRELAEKVNEQRLILQRLGRLTQDLALSAQPRRDLGPLHRLHQRFQQLGQESADLAGATERLKQALELESRWYRSAVSVLETPLPGTVTGRIDAPVQQFLLRTDQTLEHLESQLAGLIHEEQEALAALRQQAEADTRESLAVLIGLLVAALGSWLVVVWLVGRSMSRAVQRLQESAERGTEFPVEGCGETAGLALALNDMVAGIQARLKAFREATVEMNQAGAAFGLIPWSADTRGQVASDLPAWRAFTGQSLDQLLGDGWLDAVHPDDASAVLILWKEAVARGTAVEMSFRLRRGEDRAWRRVLLRAAPSGGEWTGGCADITLDQKDGEAS